MPKQIDWNKHFSAAKQFASRSEFCRKASSSYQMLHRHGKLDEACAHMPLSPRYSYKRWTAAEVFAEAAKYSSRSEFKRGCAGAYEFALANGLLEPCCMHMTDGQRWSVFEAAAAAARFETRADFIQQCGGGYCYLQKRGLAESVCDHFWPPTVARWTPELVAAEAAKCTTRSEFHQSSSGAYKRAVEWGILDQVCVHMEEAPSGFQPVKPATLYQLRITLPCGEVLYKLGITNRDVRARIRGLGPADGVTIDVDVVREYASGRDARMAEKLLHNQYSSHRYVGSAVLSNGNTELFCVRLLETKEQI